MKKISIFIIFSFACVSTLFSQTSTGFETLDYLYSIQGKSTLAGQHGRGFWFTMQQISGDYPALWGEDFMFATTGGTTSLDEWRRLIVSEAKQRWFQGSVIALMLHICPPTVNEPCDWNSDILHALSDAQWSELITDGTPLNTAWKERLDVIYPYLKELNDAGVEVLFRALHEMNQGAFWWGGRTGVNGTAKLFQITHDYLVKTKGLTNLIWVWNIQDMSSNIASILSSYDPGDNYWDVLALDVYSGNNQSNAYSSSKYNAMVAKANGKPIAIGECQLLPTAATLNSQPLWTYFMGWAELTQQYNSASVIKSLYTASPRVVALPVTVNPNQGDTLLCNFDDVNPFISPSGTSGIGLTTSEAPAGSPASGTIGVLSVPANNLSGLMKIFLDESFDPRKYVGISFLAQTDYTENSVSFIIKLQQSSDGGNANQIQDYYTKPVYNGNGAWQEVHIPFDVLLGSTGTDQLGYKLSHDPTNVYLNASLVYYDQILILPAYNQKLPAFTLNIDDIKLRTSWGEETGIPSTKSASFIISAENGIIKATGVTGNPVSLKVYSISGQEIAGGVNQVQVGTKGVYVVNAESGDVSRVSKVVVQ